MDGKDNIGLGFEMGIYRKGGVESENANFIFSLSSYLAKLILLIAIVYSSGWKLTLIYSYVDLN